MAWVAKWKGKWITKRLIVYCARIFCHSFFVSAYSCFSYAFDTITVWWWCCFSYYFLFFPSSVALAASLEPPPPLSLIYHRVSNTFHILLYPLAHVRHSAFTGSTLCYVSFRLHFSPLSLDFASNSILFIIAFGVRPFVYIFVFFFGSLFRSFVFFLLRTMTFPRNEWNNTICIHICFLWVAKATHFVVGFVSYTCIGLSVILVVGPAFSNHGVANGTLYPAQ